LDGDSDAAFLNYGWYRARRVNQMRARPPERAASAFLRLDGPAHQLKLHAMSLFIGRRLGVILRKRGEQVPEYAGEVLILPDSWREKSIDLELGPGIYEVILLNRCPSERSGAAPGLAISRIALTG
jgi:hypothetical protein